MNLSCNPPAIRPSPKATFQPHVAPRHCRAAPSGDISCFNCSPSIPCDTLERHFIPLSFLKGIARHSRGTFHVKIVPQTCRVTPSGDISCFNCSPSVSYGTLGRRFLPLSFPKGIARHSRGTFHVKIVSQACRVTPSGDVSCLNCSSSVSCGTLGRHFMLLLFPKRVARHPRATFHALIVPRECRVELPGNVSCPNCSQRVPYGTFKRHSSKIP